MPRAAVVGSPVAHSLSPVLHRAAYDALGLRDWTYDALEVLERELPAFVRSLGPDWAGLSLTMPLKQAVVPLLDRVDELAAALGVVNTLVLDRSGTRHGYNTDVEGLVRALGEAGPPAGEATGPPVVLGGGATAASAVAALRQLGHPRVEAVMRDVSRAAPVTRAGRELDVEVVLGAWQRAPELLADACVVVSTVPAGVADALAESVPERPGVLLDVVYDGWPTPLAAAWRRRGGTAVSGLRMLLHQAAAQVHLMTGRQAPVSRMAQALEAAVQAREIQRR